MKKPKTMAIISFFHGFNFKGGTIMIKVFTINLCTSVDVQLEVDDNETFEESKEYIEDNLSEIIAPYSEEIVTNAILNNTFGDAIEEC